VVEGARLESVFRGNSNVGSNPTLSAILSDSFATLYKVLTFRVPVAYPSAIDDLGRYKIDVYFLSCLRS